MKQRLLKIHHVNLHLPAPYELSALHTLHGFLVDPFQERSVKDLHLRDSILISLRPFTFDKEYSLIEDYIMIRLRKPLSRVIVEQYPLPRNYLPIRMFPPHDLPNGLLVPDPLGFRPLEVLRLKRTFRRQPG